jgi:hypothetical protein
MLAMESSGRLFHFGYTSGVPAISGDAPKTEGRAPAPQKMRWAKIVQTIERRDLDA